MDAIRKKMQSLKTETDQMTSVAQGLEIQYKESTEIADKCDAVIRDLNKKISGIEAKYDEASEGLIAATSKVEEKDILLHTEQEEAGNLSRRLILLEDEVKRRENDLGRMVVDLAMTSKRADDILRKCKYLQAKNMTDELQLEDLDKDVREATRMFQDSDKKYDELSRRNGIMEEELRRALERADLAESNINRLEEELRVVGENMHALEVAEEKALAREEKFKEQIRSVVERLKLADSRAEYGEMNITKLNHRIDDIEDDIVREKLKIKHISDQLNETFDDIFTRY